MNIWAKMMTALRGGVNEAGEAIVDTQALRILDQEVRDATEELEQSRDGLAGILARQKLAEEKCLQFKKQISEYENYAVQALEKKDDELALEVAQKIADLETQHENEENAGKGFSQSANELRAAIKQAEQNIKRIKQQIDTVKAKESVQKAQTAVAARHSGSNSKMRTAMDSLERIKEKQALKDAQIKAAGELSRETAEESLQSKLEQAGIAPGGKSAQEVLERLKKAK